MAGLNVFARSDPLYNNVGRRLGALRWLFVFFVPAYGSSRRAS
jgi:hypothetical protein